MFTGDPRPSLLVVSTDQGGSFSSDGLSLLPPDAGSGQPGASLDSEGLAGDLSLADRPFTAVDGATLRDGFSSGTARVQEETARKLGLDEEALSPSLSIEQLQAYLRRISQWMRSRGRPSP